jgi:hypothetical protein
MKSDGVAGTCTVAPIYESALGNVGIGTSFPDVSHIPGSSSKILHLHDPGTTATDFGELIVSTHGTTVGNPTGYLVFSATQVTNDRRTGMISSNIRAGTGLNISGDLTFHTNNDNIVTEKMRITPVGFVGIGTTAPSTKLHLSNGALLVKGYAANPNLNDTVRALLYLPSKGALRVGKSDTPSLWWDANVGAFSIGFGFETWASGFCSMAYGYYSKARADYTFAAGWNSQALSEGGIAIGWLNTVAATSFYGQAYGYQNNVTGAYGITFGNNCTSSGWNGIAMGFTALASGQSAVALGDSTTASGGQSFAAGDLTVASGYASVALGQQTHATAHRTVAMGYNTTASLQYATAFGNTTTAAGEMAFSGGYNTTADSYCEVVFGQWNTVPAGENTTSWVNGNQLFVLGNGTSGALRSNAMEVTKGGTGRLNGALILTSDSTIKKNITPISGVLDKLDKINAVSFEYKNQETHPTGRHIGLIAQEVELQFPELTDRNSAGELGVAYCNFTAVLLQAVKELKAENESLKARIEKLEKKK